ncbi:MAG TPA: hypothetical protein VHQ92_15585, partial [Pseudolabrys sp.]|nr:hypothetical protein [Pseudolabrys sp.]
MPIFATVAAASGGRVQVRISDEAKKACLFNDLDFGTVFAALHTERRSGRPFVAQTVFGGPT